MFLRELFYKIGPKLLEGGNLSSMSPGWQGAPDAEADEISLEIHNRTHMVEIVDQLLRSIDKVFTAQHKVNLWNPELLNSRQFLGGSSLHFLNTTGITDDEFKRLKPKVGDIDTQVDKQLEQKVHEFLTASTGKRIGNSTLLGFSQGNEQYNALFQLVEPPIKLQIDFEFGRYDPESGTPDEWFRFSHSSNWADIQAGVKGVFHKYLYRSLSGLSAKEFYVAKPVGRGKARAIQVSDTPETDSTVSFAVSGSQGGGVSEKYKPYLDPATGQPMMKNGLPVLEPVEAKNRPYAQNLAQQFQMMFGAEPTPEDSKLQQSFIGTLDLINKYVDPSKKPEIVEKFLDICFEVGSQMITKGDPARDAQTKFVAVDLMLQKLELNQMRPRAVEMAKTYEDDFNEVEAYKKANPNERQPRAALKKAKALQQLAEAEVVQSKRKGIVHLEKMRDIDFLDLLDELKTEHNRFHLQNIPMNVKVDGFGGRFGMDEQGRPYAETSRSGPKFQAGQFVAYAKAKGASPESLEQSAKWDQWWDQMIEVTNAVARRIDLRNVKVHVEVLYLPFAEIQEDGRLKFVGIKYDALPKGITMALVPLFAEISSTGEPHPHSNAIIKQIKDIGQVGKTMLIDNGLTTNGEIDATAVLPPLENLETFRNMLLSKDKGINDRKKEVATALQTVKDNFAKFVINHPAILGKDILGKDYEGIVLNTQQGHVKITSPEQKQVISDKNAAKASARTERPRGESKTAVVAIGSFIGHKGHQELFNFTINKAKELGGDPYLFIGNAEGKDDPIPPATKVETWHKLYPQYANNISTVVQGGSLMQKVKHELINPLPGKPPRYDNIVIMVGEDRKDMPIANALMKAVNKFAGYEHVRVHLEVTPRGQGVSGTALRKAAKEYAQGNEQAFNQWRDAFNTGTFGAKPLPDAWIKHLVDVTLKGMGVTPQAQQPQANTNIEDPNSIKYANKVIREMRAREFLSELSVKPSGKQHQHQVDGGQGYILSRDVGGYDRTYHLNRIMMAAAMADGKSKKPVDMDSSSWVEKYNVAFPYTDMEHAMMMQAFATVPSDVGELEKRGKSEEPKDTNKTSTVAKPKKNKYGI